MSVHQSTRIGIAATAVIGAFASLSLPAAANAADQPPTITHNEVETVHHTEDICGDRENDTTYTRKVVVERFVEASDGSVRYHYTARVNYVSDFVDPTIPDARGSLTEVFTFNLNPGDTVTGTGTFHDYIGDEIRIYERFHYTVVDGEGVVDRHIFSVEGCP